MLKHRIIPILLWDGNQCCKPVSFQRPYRKLGVMEQYIQVMERRNIDELIIIDIEATNQKRNLYYDKLRRFCDNLFCPVTYGGGISTLGDISSALNSGADKVAIKTNIHIIPSAVEKFGAQAIVGVIDFKEKHNFQPYLPCIEYVKYLKDLGIGEVLLTDMEKDGTLTGYNYDLILDVSNAVGIPVIANGGCGAPEHMLLALNAGASAVAAGSMFLYTEETPKSCAEYLNSHGVPVRL